MKQAASRIITQSLPTDRIEAALQKFLAWLDRYGEESHDFQSFYAGTLGGKAKTLYYRHRFLGTLAVSPIIFCEAFIPSARRFFWIPQRFPIADAHYAMGFAFLSRTFERQPHYDRAVHFLEVLKETRCAGYENHAWGYPFDWGSLEGTVQRGTPLITTLPYVYEAFKEVYQLDKNEGWRQVMRSIAQHALLDYRDIPTSPRAASSAYSPNPNDPGRVVNASAYRASLLFNAALDFSERKYREAAERNMNFVLESQNPDGSWYYAMDGRREFIDHFHTCFVLKALAKIEKLTRDSRCTQAIERGIRYYVSHLFDEQRLPKPFSKRPRLTIYRRELYDYAECINLGMLLRGRFTELDAILLTVLQDVLDRWQKPDGSFRSRQLLLGWDNVPMHRWAQSQIFRSLSFALERVRS